MKKTTRKKRTKREYFTKVHENAILDYCTSNCKDEKTALYQEFIQPAFDELVDKIVYTYKFNTLPNIDELKDECKVWLTTILEKFDVSKGSKAFSYFSVITKNWFIHKVKKHNKARLKEVNYEDVHKYVPEDQLTVENTYIEDRSSHEFWQALWKEIDKWGDMEMKPQEEKVYKAIKILFENPDDIEIFNKKAIYLYLRELTGLNTKQIVNNLNKLRVKYQDFKKDWHNQ